MIQEDLKVGHGFVQGCRFEDSQAEVHSVLGVRLAAGIQRRMVGQDPRYWVQAVAIVPEHNCIDRDISMR